MKYLCLAYGAEEDWNRLSESEQRELLAQDTLIRGRGNVMSAVRGNVVSVRNWNKQLQVTDHAYAEHELPLAGFSIIEADDIGDVVRLVADTPCARANGVIEIRPFWDPEASTA